MEAKNLHFASGGYFGLYHIGALSYIEKYCPQLLNRKITGSSYGIVVAALMLCSVPLDDIAFEFFTAIKKTRLQPAGGFHLYMKINRRLAEILDDYMPEDAHKILNKKLEIYLATWDKQEFVTMDTFESRDELIRALCATCFLPHVSGVVPPLIRERAYVDGALAHALPSTRSSDLIISPCIPFKENSYVSGFMYCKITKVCSEKYKKAIDSFFVPAEMSLSDICRRGLLKAKSELESKNLRRCRRCLSKIFSKRHGRIRKGWEGRKNHLWRQKQAILKLIEQQVVFGDDRLSDSVEEEPFELVQTVEHATQVSSSNIDKTLEEDQMESAPSKNHEMNELQGFGKEEMKGNQEVIDEPILLEHPVALNVFREEPQLVSFEEAVTRAEEKFEVLNSEEPTLAIPKETKECQVDQVEASNKPSKDKSTQKLSNQRSSENILSPNNIRRYLLRQRHRRRQRARPKFCDQCFLLTLENDLIHFEDFFEYLEEYEEMDVEDDPGYLTFFIVAPLGQLIRSLFSLPKRMYDFLTKPKAIETKPDNHSSGNMILQPPSATH